MAAAVDVVSAVSVVVNERMAYLSVSHAKQNNQVTYHYNYSYAAEGEICCHREYWEVFHEICIYFVRDMLFLLSRRWATNIYYIYNLDGATKEKKHQAIFE